MKCNIKYAAVAVASMLENSMIAEILVKVMCIHKNPIDPFKVTKDYLFAAYCSTIPNFTSLTSN